MTELIDKFEKALLSLDRVAAGNLLLAADGSPLPRRAVEDLFAATLDRIGQQWEAGTVALAQVYMSGRICEDLANMLPCANVAPNHLPPPRMAIAVLEDHHFLGKRMVDSVLRASGFPLLDYGHQDVDSLIRRANEDGIEVLLISTLMLSSALRVADVRAKLDSGIKVLVGGAPFRLDEQLWREVGADAMGRNASDSVALISRVMAGEL